MKQDITTIRNNIIQEKEERKKEREKERAIIHNTRPDSELYATKQWKKLRNYYITQHPICEIHTKYGIIKPSETVHHMRPFMLGKTLDEQKKLCYDETNLQALCKSCHHQVHAELNWCDGKLNDCLPYELVEY